MAKKWFIPEVLVRYCTQNASGSFIQHRELADGELALFNKNGLRYQYFQNCYKTMNRYGYVGEAAELDPYFSREVEEEV